MVWCVKIQISSDKESNNNIGVLLNGPCGLKRILLVVACLLGIPAVLTGSLSCQKGYSGQVEPIAVAWSPFEQNALLWVAEDQNLFSKNGLDVSFHKYDSGVASLNGMMNGEADITIGVSEFPIVKAAFGKTKVCILGAAAKIEQQYVVARKDKGIEKIADLKGKRIGTTIGTIAEFYLGRFLELNGMSVNDVTVVDLKTPAEWENAVPDGTVDAIVTAQPYADLASNHLGSNAIIWPAQSGQYIYGLIVSSDDWVANNSEAARRFLKSLVQAEGYAGSHPSEVKAIIQKRLNVDTSLTESIWSRDQFSVTLDQSLIVTMEEEARWVISNNLRADQKVPNFLDYIYTDGLKAINPQAVQVIGK